MLGWLVARDVLDYWFVLILNKKKKKKNRFTCLFDSWNLLDESLNFKNVVFVSCNPLFSLIICNEHNPFLLILCFAQPTNLFEFRAKNMKDCLFNIILLISLILLHNFFFLINFLFFFNINLKPKLLWLNEISFFFFVKKILA